MTWLDGIPTRERPLRWPSGAETFRAKAYSNPPNRKSGSCILDDRICTFMSYMGINGQGETAVYLGDIAIKADSVVMEEIALIPFYLVSIVLLPRKESRRALFCSVEIPIDDAGIILRIHTRSGSEIQKTHIRATAAFGRLVVQDEQVAICVSSGKEPVQKDFVLNKRIDFTSLRSTVQKPGYPDTIVCWDLQKDLIREIYIPHLDTHPILHSGSFSFVSSDRVALAGHVQQSFADVTAGVLKYFSIQESSQKNFTIMQASDMNAEIGMISRDVGIPGSSGSSDIFLHYYSSGDQMSLFHKDLFSGRIEIDSDSRQNCTNAMDHPHLHRTVRAKFSSQLPSISGNRALVQGSMGSALYDGPSRLLVLDFELERVKRLTGLTEPAKTSLAQRLKAANAAVKVVTRRILHYADGNDEDGECPDEDRPAEWQAHLDRIHDIEQEQEDVLPPLEFDEAAEEHRGDDLFGCTASVLQLPKDVGMDSVATAVVVVEHYFISSGFGPEWRVFDFDDEIDTSVDTQVKGS